jgi:hypothetical protein
LVSLVLLQSHVRLSAADAAGLMQLAINDLNSDESAVFDVLCRLPSQLDATAARRLVLTAAVRQHGELAK